MLHHLNLWCSFPEDFALTLPTLTSLRLSGKFSSYGSFARFMTGFPALQDLALYDVNWEASPDDLTFPRLELKSLTLSWDPDFRPPAKAIESVILSLRTRALTVYHMGIFPADYLRSLSKYLHHLGGHLQYLCLPMEIIQRKVCMLDFRHSTALRHLKIENAVSVSVRHAAGPSAWASPDVERILANIIAHCRLETLSFSAQSGGSKNYSWKPLPQWITELKLNVNLNAIREIRFIVVGLSGLRDSDGRKDLESVLSALPQSTIGEIVFE
ncbi:hypothetical protein B0H16DRAFT_468718 [Mycena metata]|uniref:Uncharacterized protein n=1 Tax=Mycena metata TaxID=1033252 RepID=A0AAD7P0A0_9AGAR|nr:hypothetical protein B0H16DRAFT_468718 [Mycena metata]